MSDKSGTVKIKSGEIKSLKEEYLSAPLDPARQQMVFRYEYETNARIFQRRGWYIDRRGGVYKYSYERLFDSHNLLEIKFQLRFKVRPTLIARIPVDVLEEKIALLGRIESDDCERKFVADDAGIGKIGAFATDATGERREINLLIHGDCEGKNNSKEAAELLEWLFRVVPECTF